MPRSKAIQDTRRRDALRRKYGRGRVAGFLGLAVFFGGLANAEAQNPFCLPIGPSGSTSCLTSNSADDVYELLVSRESLSSAIDSMAFMNLQENGQVRFGASRVLELMDLYELSEARLLIGAGFDPDETCFMYTTSGEPIRFMDDATLGDFPFESCGEGLEAIVPHAFNAQRLEVTELLQDAGVTMNIAEISATVAEIMSMSGYVEREEEIPEFLVSEFEGKILSMPVSREAFEAFFEASGLDVTPGRAVPRQAVVVNSDGDLTSVLVSPQEIYGTSSTTMEAVVVTTANDTFPDFSSDGFDGVASMAQLLEQTGPNSEAYAMAGYGEGEWAVSSGSNVLVSGSISSPLNVPSWIINFVERSQLKEEELPEQVLRALQRE